MFILNDDKFLHSYQFNPIEKHLSITSTNIKFLAVNINHIAINKSIQSYLIDVRNIDSMKYLQVIKRNLE